MRIWQTGPVRSLGVSAGAVQSLLMASIERRTRADGRVAWDARYRDPAGVQRKRTFSRKIDAQRYLTSIESAKNAGSYLDPRAGHGTFAEQAKRWRAGKVALMPSTLRSYDALL